MVTIATRKVQCPTVSPAEVPMGVTGSMGGRYWASTASGSRKCKSEDRLHRGDVSGLQVAGPAWVSDVAAMHREPPPQALWGPRVSQGHGLELLGNVLVFVHVAPGWAQVWSGRGHRETGWVWKGHSWLTSVHGYGLTLFLGTVNPIVLWSHI